MKKVLSPFTKEKTTINLERCPKGNRRKEKNHNGWGGMGPSVRGGKGNPLASNSWESIPSDRHGPRQSRRRCFTGSARGFREARGITLVSPPGGAGGLALGCSASRRGLLEDWMQAGKGLLPAREKVAHQPNETPKRPRETSAGAGHTLRPQCSSKGVGRKRDFVETYVCVCPRGKGENASWS